MTLCPRDRELLTQPDNFEPPMRLSEVAAKYMLEAAYLMRSATIFHDEAGYLIREAVKELLHAAGEADGWSAEEELREVADESSMNLGTEATKDEPGRTM